MAAELMSAPVPAVPRMRTRALRILSFGSVPPESGGTTRGGVATFHATLLGELRDGAGYGAEVVGLVPFNFGAESRPVSSVTVHLPPAGADEQEFYAQLLEETAADVVIFNHVAQRWAVIHARRAPEVPAVGIVHSWSALKFRAGEERERVRRTLVEAMDGMAVLVFPSAHMRAEGQRLGFDYSVRTEVIHYPLDPLFGEEVDVETTRSGVLFVGALVDAVKNPSALIEAAASSDFELTLVGEGTDADRLHRLAADFGVASRVHFVGAIPTAAVREALVRSELLCVPSHSESLGIAYLEALACGTPIVGFGPSVVELEQLLGLPVGARLLDGSSAEVGAAIAAVRAGEWPRQVLRERALEAFSATAVTRRYVELFREVAA